MSNVTKFTWKMTSQHQKDEYFREFEKAFSWPSDWEHEVKKMWNEKAARRYSGFISSLKVMYKAGKSRPIYVPDGLINHWKDPNVIKRSEAARKTRMSEPDGPGIGISKQRGGSVSIEERSMWKAAERGVSIMDCVYESFSDLHRFKDVKYTCKSAGDCCNAG
ncbi:uncharacterized protein LOC125192264 [Salvia hispanica]|uniref:uncharacterized protein LOC125192264 n=1 Tax=Salvia hispanica TaxID=49212 RepID=UPI002008F788|nr:uncharacterized protein LOC125192264 [Salvia hispanica]XP_047945746.1 uncharacterized protein LOC125192264 [Salvia hispanica]